MLTKGTASEHFREFCPNAVSLEELVGQKRATVLALGSEKQTRAVR